MATDKQIQANRLNAQKSTGPQTPEGKKRVARNNRKHGLAGEHVVLDNEDHSAFDALLAALLDEWEPQSETEILLVETMAQNQWRLLRCLRLERAAFQRQLKEMNPGVVPFNTPLSVDSISRYEGRSNRAFYRALDTLRKLQAERRKLAESRSAIQPASVPAPALVEPQLEQNKAAPPPAGPVIPIGNSNPNRPEPSRYGRKPPESETP